MSETFDGETFARVLHAVRFRSRRSAKRMLHEAGMTHASAADLDRVLAEIQRQPNREEIEAQAEALEVARLEQQRRSALDKVPPEGDLPEWLIGKTPQWGRTFIVHMCPGGSDSFVGEIFDDRADAPPGLEWHRLDDGQVLSNITWFDGERPPEDRVRDLMRIARQELRIHDAQADADE